MNRKRKNEALHYAENILSGRIIAGKWLKLCAERHLKDLEDGHKRGLRFDEESAQHAIDFFQFLRHSKGEWAGQVFELAPWQKFITGVLFGWKNARGLRRFRTAYIECARKSGKTTWLAGTGLYLFVADNEPGAEIYTAATHRDQARISHSEATRMVKTSPGLSRRIRIFKDNLNIPDTASKFEPLGRDSDSCDGLNIHGALIDELHAHKTRDMWDVLETATGSRRQPLQIAITTAGFDRHTICWEQHQYVEKILEGIIQDDTYFGIIYGIDEEDDWEDEKCWIKANPGLGISVKLDDLQRKAKKAKETPSALNAFLRLHLDKWTESVTRWLSTDSWNACATAVDGDGVRGRICYAGLDLSSTTDISAFVLVFPPATNGDKYQVLCRFFVPQDNARDRARRDKVPYETWIREGYITATPGNVVDYAFILAQIDEDAQKYDLQALAFDRWGATKVMQDLQEMGFERPADNKRAQRHLIDFGQGFASMTSPTKELEKLVLSGQLAHGGNPVLSWMASNVVVRQDPAGNIKPDKEKSTEKIDGIVALIMALDRATRHAGNHGSVYETRGMLML